MLHHLLFQNELRQPFLENISYTSLLILLSVTKKFNKKIKSRKVLFDLYRIHDLSFNNRLSFGRWLILKNLLTITPHSYLFRHKQDEWLVACQSGDLDYLMSLDNLDYDTSFLLAFCNERFVICDWILEKKNNYDFGYDILIAGCDEHHSFYLLSSHFNEKKSNINVKTVYLKKIIQKVIELCPDKILSLLYSAVRVGNVDFAVYIHSNINTHLVTPTVYNNLLELAHISSSNETIKFVKTLGQSFDFFPLIIKNKMMKAIHCIIINDETSLLALNGLTNNKKHLLLQHLIVCGNLDYIKLADKHFHLKRLLKRDVHSEISNPIELSISIGNLKILKWLNNIGGYTRINISHFQFAMSCYDFEIVKWFIHKFPKSCKWFALARKIVYAEKISLLSWLLKIFPSKLTCMCTTNKCNYKRDTSTIENFLFEETLTYTNNPEMIEYLIDRKNGIYAEGWWDYIINIIKTENIGSNTIISLLRDIDEKVNGKEIMMKRWGYKRNHFDIWKNSETHKIGI